MTPGPAVVRPTAASEFFAWRAGGVGRRRVPCAECGAEAPCQLLENLLELLCPRCGRNVVLGRARALERTDGRAALAARLQELGLLEPDAEAAPPEGSLVDALIDRGALRRDLRLTLELDRTAGTHAYGAAPLRDLVLPAEVEAALEARRAGGGTLAALLRRSVLDRWAATIRSIGAEVGLERLASADAIDPAARDALPPRAMQIYRAIPCALREDGAVVVALWNPLDFELVADLEALRGAPIEAALAESALVAEVLAAWRVPPPDDASGTGDDLPAPEAELEPLDPDDDPLSSLLLEALEEGAREALLEPVGGGARLRLRIGDELRKERKVSGDAPSAVADALDALAAADLQAIEGRGLLGAIRAGRARCEVSGLPVHLAYRVIDTPLGPSLAISLDDESRPARASLGELGLDLEGLAAFEAALARRQGITILAAPDPRDRALAYRACLERAVRLGGAVVSLERPVHAVVPGVTQLDLEPGVSPALEALLYPVPDWLGLEVPRVETRTLRLAVDVALAGGAVLLTVAAPDVTRALQRLELAGLPPAMSRTVINAALARRVVPRICPHCRVARDVPDGAEPAWIGLGCAACADQGVRAGLLPLAELWSGGRVDWGALETRSLADVARELSAAGEVPRDAVRDLVP